MARRALRLLVPAGAALLVASQWTDIRRYLTIKRDRPQDVPVSGRKAYPQRPGGGAADGTGDFDSASRGGPAHHSPGREIRGQG
jgi:hypothetical protein